MLKPLSITKDANQFDAEDRESMERILGRRLEDNERVFISTIPMPDPETRRRVREDMTRITQEIIAFQEKEGIMEEEVNAAVDEAVEHARQHKHS